MKIIDQTPFFNSETGEIRFLDRGKAMMKFGTSWIKEVEAQKQVIEVLSKVLDRNYTLLRNVTPPGLDASFPFILVGPAGVFVMYVTPLTGIFRAKGDQWGTIAGNTFHDEKPNLLTRTERMARAIQVYLQRQGYSSLTMVEAILLCSDPSVHVDSIRPIIRVVMRDALERLAISIMQARAVLSPETILNVIDRILNPPVTESSEPAETAEETSQELAAAPQTEELYIPAFALPESDSPPSISESTPLPIIVPQLTESEMEFQPPAPVKKKQNRKPWLFLILMFVLWIIIMAGFLYLVIKDQPSFLLSLLP